MVEDDEDGVTCRQTRTTRGSHDLQRTEYTFSASSRCYLDVKSVLTSSQYKGEG